MTDRLRAVERGITYIGSVQRRDGGFDGLASTEPLDFSTARIHPTVFFTALIAESVATIAPAQAIGRRSVDYLLHHKRPDWSWNYWERSAAGKSMQGYPDDLDDTACAVGAVLAQRPECITAAVLGHIGQLLVACEQKPGGPYRTWLVSPANLKEWDDVDLAVNANIAHMLAGMDVVVPGLEAFLIDSIRSGKLASNYYLGIYPSLYFLARITWPGVRRTLRRTVSRELTKQPLRRTALANALLLAAACRLGCRPQRSGLLAACLISQQQAGAWPASALYVEPLVGGVPYYAGSAALTTAFVCEALTLYDAAVTATGSFRLPSDTSRPLATAFDEVGRYAASLPGAALRREYRRTFMRISRIDSDGQISRLAGQLCGDMGAQLPAEMLQHLEIASINGWMAYTLYDDVLDGATGPLAIGAANVALRQCETHFRQALPQSDEFAVLVQAALTTVDAANAWEQQSARAPVAAGVIHLPILPRYGSYYQLARRSWGHVLAGCGVLSAAGFAAGSPEQRQWQRFFRHFLIARQLVDDAHDWQDDLTAGQLSAVVCMLLQTTGLPEQFSIEDAMDRLKACFWETVVLTVCADITKQLDAAETALRACHFLIRSAYYDQLIVQLRGSVTATLQGRQKALSFIRAFTQPAER